MSEHSKGLKLHHENKLFFPNITHYFNDILELTALLSLKLLSNTIIWIANWEKSRD